MRVSLAWLREIFPTERPAREIAEALTGRGLPVDAVEETGGDVALEVDVPANRPDALGHRGIAREVAAAFGGTLRPVATPAVGSGPAVSASVEVEVDDPARCARYVAGIVRRVRVGPSPDWVVARLHACGLRSVNNVVDVSNLVMMELGQPVHFFDLATLSGPRIRIRGSRPGETLVTLDGVERSLLPGTLVIADSERAVALAGVIGGADTEITERTTDVLVEAAWFDPAAVRATARGLGVVTDASQRFERGCDPDAPPVAQDLAARLLADLASGVPAPGPVDVRPVPRPRRRLSVRLARVERLLGFPVTAGEALAALDAVGLEPVSDGAGVIETRVPSWRVDLEREADLVEEIGRHLGYDRVPDRLPPGLPTRPVSPPPPLEETTRDLLAALGFHEAVNYAMIGTGEDDPFVLPDSPPALRLSNPIAEGLADLRRSLLPGLLRAADRNLRRGAEEVRLFEVGRVFFPGPAGAPPVEPLRAGFAWSGHADTPHWSGTGRTVDLWDAAGVVEALLEGAGTDATWRREAEVRTGFHPGRSVAWRVGSRAVAWCGELHPGLRSALGAPADVYLGEVDLSLLLELPSLPRATRPVPRVPAVRRDLSVVLEAGTAAGALLERLRAVPSPEPAALDIVDRYVGTPLEAGASAVTVRVMLQPLERTLSDDVIERYRQALVAAVTSGPGFRMRE